MSNMQLGEMEAPDVPARRVELDVNSKPYNPKVKNLQLNVSSQGHTYMHILNKLNFNDNCKDLNPELDNHQKMVVCECLAELGIFSDEPEPVFHTKVKSKRQDNHSLPKGSKTAMRPIRA